MTFISRTLGQFFFYCLSLVAVAILSISWTLYGILNAAEGFLERKLSRFING